MPTDAGADGGDRVMRIRDRRERFDNTGDVTAIANHLAEDVVLMPPEAPSITGKAAGLEGVIGGRSYEIGQTNENLVTRGDLAVDRFAMTGPRDSTAYDDSDDRSVKGVDIDRRDASGTEKCTIAIWNNQV